jgi:uncharacterized SAM-binding protein YcdF (DUF218 family)
MSQHRFFVRLILTAFGLWAAALAVIDGYGQHDRAQPADVIVVLGARVYAGGRLGPSLTRRAQHAAALYQQGYAPSILCTGGLGTDPPTEAEAACGLIAELGVPRTALFFEMQSHSTEENALYSAVIAREQGWTSALIVSDGYHLLRATLLFQRAGFSVYPSPAQLTGGPMNPIERAARESRELAALLWFWGKLAVGSTATDFP